MKVIRNPIENCLLCLVAILLVIPAAGISDFKYGWPEQTQDAEKAVNVSEPDWLNPFGAGRPEWDPYGPSGGEYFASRPGWDPYASYDSGVLRLQKSDPIQEGLSVEGNLRSVNQLYVQNQGALTVDGDVYLGEPIVLWASVGSWGGFSLYDYGDLVMSQGYLGPGWYRITGAFAEVMGTHSYGFVSGGYRSNNVTFSVNPGGYPVIYALVGRVVNQYGYGMSGVQVRMANNEGGTFTRSTDMSGYYGMNVPSGYYFITAYKPGYSFTQSTGRVWTGTVSAARIIVGYPA